MVAEQMAEHGRPVNTPDVLFLDHVKINDQPIAWIDAALLRSRCQFSTKENEKTDAQIC